MTTAQLYQLFIAADDAWMAEVRKLPGRPGDVRYTKAAHGEPGTMLRTAYYAFVSTGNTWRESVEADRRKAA